MKFHSWAKHIYQRSVVALPTALLITGKSQHFSDLPKIDSNKLYYVNFFFKSIFNITTTKNTHTQDKNTCTLVCQGDEQVDIPILEVSRSNTTYVEFWISDVHRGVDVGA